MSDSVLESISESNGPIILTSRGQNYKHFYSSFRVIGL